MVGIFISPFYFPPPGLLYFQASGEDGRLFHLTADKLEEGLQRAKHEVIHGCIFLFSSCLSYLRMEALR